MNQVRAGSAFIELNSTRKAFRLMNAYLEVTDTQDHDLEKQDLFEGLSAVDSETPRWYLNNDSNSLFKFSQKDVINFLCALLNTASTVCIVFANKMSVLSISVSQALQETRILTATQHLHRSTVPKISSRHRSLALCHDGDSAMHRNTETVQLVHAGATGLTGCHAHLSPLRGLFGLGQPVSGSQPCLILPADQDHDHADRGGRQLPNVPETYLVPLAFCHPGLMSRRRLA